MKTIAECNKLIAEFMGRCGKVNKHLYWVNIPSVKWVTVEQMQFHTSWDWLIPVVEKIEKTYAYVDIKGCAVNISTIVETSAPTKIEAVYMACVEFIEWYNNK